MMFDLTGKTALVTGAGGGIGGAVARVLHRQGAAVVLVDMKAEGIEALKAELKTRAYSLVCNVTDAAAVEALPKQAEEMAGSSVDILINNAGITRDNLLMRMKDEEWDLVLAVNLTAGFKLARAHLRGMLKKRWGRIVSISSVVGATGNPGQCNYSATKAGITAMSKSLGQEVASRGITVNCVAPGFVKTPMTDVLSDEVKKALLSRIPLGRLSTPDDIANAVLFLSSEEAGYITGQTIHVNGGMAMIS
jgi:3-oxoacyl-[acyl-carrier protein] reductase